MESTMKELRGGASVLEPMSNIGGGVEDVYGEDRATEDQLITPWAFSVASGYSLLRDPRYNKGLAFSETERDAHYLRGLLPPAVLSQQLQEKKLMMNLRQYQLPMQKYMALMDLQERNERLFFKLLIDNVEELLPIVYTPTVGEACQKYGSIFRRPQGLFISLKEKGKILEVLKNWPERSIQVIVVTDGERILGLGDLGCQGMGIPVGKLALYTALGGVRPSMCLPVTIDVGINNEQLLKDEFYIGLRRKRVTGQEYDDLLHEFMCAVKQNFGEKVLIQGGSDVVQIFEVNYYGSHKLSHRKMAKNSGLHQEIAAFKQSLLQEGFLNDAFKNNLEYVESLGNPNFAEKIMTMYFIESNKYIEEAEKILDSEPVNTLELNRILRNLYRSSAMTGAHRVSNEASKLRDRGLDGNWDCCKASLQMVKRERAELKDRMATYFQMMRRAGPVEAAEQPESRAEIKAEPAETAEASASRTRGGNV